MTVRILTRHSGVVHTPCRQGYCHYTIELAPLCVLRSGCASASDAQRKIPYFLSRVNSSCFPTYKHLRTSAKSAVQNGDYSSNIRVAAKCPRSIPSPLGCPCIINFVFSFATRANRPRVCTARLHDAGGIVFLVRPIIGPCHRRLVMPKKTIFRLHSLRRRCKIFCVVARWHNWESYESFFAGTRDNLYFLLLTSRVGSLMYFIQWP